MNSNINAVRFFVLMSLGALVACGCSSTSSTSSGGGGGTSSSSSSSSGGAGGGTSSSSSSSSGGAGGGGAGGCGGGCLDPGQCYSQADCSADEYCLQDNCYPVGQCTSVPSGCTAGKVCGCNGVVYDDPCAAAQSGQSTYLSLTECSDLPAGQFPCGEGFCNLADQYCRQGLDGALACAAPPPECAADPSCSCLAGKINCGLCSPTKGGGALATQCEG